MPLSEREQQLLEQLERQLHAEDPSFADSMHHEKTGSRPASGLSVRHLVIGIVVAVLGLGVVLAGVATKLVVVGVLGFVVMAAGVYWASTGGRTAGKDAAPVAGARTTAGSAAKSSYLQKLERQWEERRRER